MARIVQRIRTGFDAARLESDVRVQVPLRAYIFRQAHARVKAESAHAVGFSIAEVTNSIALPTIQRGFWRNQKTRPAACGCGLDLAAEARGNRGGANPPKPRQFKRTLGDGYLNSGSRPQRSLSGQDYQDTEVRFLPCAPLSLRCRGNACSKQARQETR